MGFRGRGLSYRPTQLSHSISTGRRRFASESRYGSKRSVSIVVGWRRSPTHGRNPRGAVSIVNASSGRGSHQPAQSILVPEAQTELAKGFNTLEALRTNGACKPDDSYTEGHANETKCSKTSQISVFSAKSIAEFSVAAELRATAFYDDLEARQALPFPPRFIATFRREFAQRECLALKERTAKLTGTSRRCLCLMAKHSELGLVGCLDISARVGPCASQVNGLCIDDDEEYVYIDNVAVDGRARRLGSASAMLEVSSGIALEWGACFVYTHVHADNVAARRLYHAYGFRAPKGNPLADVLPSGKATPWASPRLAGLILLRAPLPLVREDEGTASLNCICGASFENCEKCVCISVSRRCTAERMRDGGGKTE